MMSPESALHIAQLVLAVHMMIAVFVIFGMVAIPLGAARGWPFVFVFSWRVTHLGFASVVALQKVAGATCFLSVWEFNLLGRASQANLPVSPIHALAINIMHWNMPLWFFTALYVTVLLYIAWQWWRVPPELPWRGHPSEYAERFRSIDALLTIIAGSSNLTGRRPAFEPNPNASEPDVDPESDTGEAGWVELT